MFQKKSLVLILFVIFAPIYAAENQTTITDESAQKAAKYGEYAYNIYVILSAIFAMALFITLILISHNYGFKHMVKAILILSLIFGAGALIFLY